MSSVRSGEHEHVGRRWFGAREAAQLPARSEQSQGERFAGRDAADDAAPRSRWWRLPLRVLRDALIAAVLISSVPVAFILVAGGVVWQQSGVVNTQQKLASAQGLRAWMLPRDATITPLEAGRAFGRLGNPKPTPDFPLVDVGPSPMRGWVGRHQPEGQFPESHLSSYNGPSPEGVMVALARGLTAGELATLKAIATSPVWDDFDRFARAPQADLIGARFQLPFKPTAQAYAMPITRFSGSKELAYASVARAAYYQAIGDHAAAEQALRSTISFGFGLIDNGATLIDQLIGRVITEIGRDGMRRLLEITHDPRATEFAIRIPTPIPQPAGPPLDRVTWWNLAPLREHFIATAVDPAQFRGVRYHSLAMLAFTPCTNVRELLFGPRPDVTRAFEQAKGDFARFPSERALVDLLSQELDRVHPQAANSLARRWLLGAATVGGALTGNPRIVSCTALITSSF